MAAAVAAAAVGLVFSFGKHTPKTQPRMVLLVDMVVKEELAETERMDV